MPPKPNAPAKPRAKPAPARKAAPAKRPAASASLQDALALLESHASTKVRDGMARYAIPADKAIGVSVGNIRLVAKRLGRDHALAAALWGTDVYEARMLACFVDDPAQVTSA